MSLCQQEEDMRTIRNVVAQVRPSQRRRRARRSTWVPQRDRALRRGIRDLL